ncbi:pentatricopeptide repeat-containing protein At1g53600, mitochondrial-like [Papaver somniferum]|uniref:pentatricopeptide repeat-containing protein At1g53600, mitochondrial-like n=1 Tax=Papaver somniferum TaxID=3469 RepID=UPI000E6FE615|nr:pentatricopeptide repeat-containing protein At1g53600, mitochondrial-like [Papaver somniferum]
MGFLGFVFAESDASGLHVRYGSSEEKLFDPLSNEANKAPSAAKLSDLALFDQKRTKSYIHMILWTYEHSTPPSPNYLTLSFQTLTNSKTNSSKIISTKFFVQRNSEITKNGRNGNLREAESIFNQLPTKNIISWTSMLTTFAENNEITKARRLPMFDEMPQRNTATRNAMIAAYTCNTCHVNKAYELFCKVPERIVVTYAVMITVFFRVGMLNEAEKIYYEMPEIGRDLVVSNAMINEYLKLGELERAVFVFDSMVERNVISWSSISDGYCMNGKVSDAEVLFQKMPEKNVVSWTAMISEYMKSGKWVKGFECFSKMRREEHVEVNPTTITVILDTCTSLGRFKEGFISPRDVCIFSMDAVEDTFTISLNTKVLNLLSLNQLAACNTPIASASCGSNPIDWPALPPSQSPVSPACDT